MNKKVTLIRAKLGLKSLYRTRKQVAQSIQWRISQKQLKRSKKVCCLISRLKLFTASRKLLKKTHWLRARKACKKLTRLYLVNKWNSIKEASGDHPWRDANRRFRYHIEPHTNQNVACRQFEKKTWLTDPMTTKPLLIHVVKINPPMVNNLSTSWTQNRFLNLIVSADHLLTLARMKTRQIPIVWSQQAIIVAEI